MKELGLYIHIPFCVKKCFYCDFPSFAGMKNEYDAYIGALIQEMETAQQMLKQYKIASVFLGGGTPSILPPALTSKIMDCIFNCFNIAPNAEITTEANPGTLDKKKLQQYRAIGINRLSLGLQAYQDRHLKRLGRIHTFSQFQESFLLAREAGFQNINIDIMFSIPFQTKDEWAQTLDVVASMAPEHISAYSLIIEDGTPFSKLHQADTLELPDELEDREMYHEARIRLEENGYHQYEISNFAKTGFECRHNQIYWKTQEYVGLGLGAHSYLNEMRYHNSYDMKKYIAAKGDPLALHENKELLTTEQKWAEFMFMGLRETKGILKSTFEARFCKKVEQVYGEQLRQLKQDNLLEETEHSIFLTPYGIDISNYIFEKFILTNVIENQVDMDIVYESKRLLFKRMNKNDFTEIAKMLQNPEVMYAWEHDFTDEAIYAWIEKRNASYKLLGYDYFLAIDKQTKEVVGQIGLLDEPIHGKHVTGIGYILKKEYWHKGYATEGAKAMLTYGFTILKKDKIIATIRPENKASCKVAKRIGMEIESDFIKIYNGKEILHLVYAIEAIEKI